MDAKKILLGVSAVVAAAALTACSSGTTASGSATPQLAAAAAPVSSTPSAVATTTTVPPAPTTTTTVAPPPVTTTTHKPAPVVASGIPCTVAVSACVSISLQEAWLVSDGKVVYGPVRVKTGRRGYPTPVGVFHVQYRQKLHISKEFQDAPMPNSVFFTSGVAFHEGSLSESSHGCVHLSASNSLHFYDTLKVGQTVQVVR